MTRRFTAALAAACALAVAAAGAAAAGNGNGQANGNSGQSAAAQTLQTPPGQAKQDATPAAAPQTPPGQAKQTSPAATPAAKPAPTTKPAKAAKPAQTTKPAKADAPAKAASTAPGVKPGPGTAHWTHCTIGAGSTCSNGTPSSPPDASKRYGNGHTAAGIATSRGAPAGTVLTGPGNSQPHKVTVCGKPSNRSGGVDVHAVKSYDASACATAPQTAVTAAPAPAAVQAPAAATPATPAPAAAASPAAPAPAPAAVASAATAGTPSPAAPAAAMPAVPAAPAAGGVLGAETTLRHPAHGVLGAVHTTRPGGSTLPFTGLSLALFCLIAAGLVATGVLLRRTARPDRP